MGPSATCGPGAEEQTVDHVVLQCPNPSTSPWTAWPDGSGWWDSWTPAQLLPQDFCGQAVDWKNWLKRPQRGCLVPLHADVLCSEWRTKCVKWNGKLCWYQSACCELIRSNTSRGSGTGGNKWKQEKLQIFLSYLVREDSKSRVCLALLFTTFQKCRPKKVPPGAEDASTTVESASANVLKSNCFSCGGPARNVECNKCRKTWHFAKVCLEV